LLEKIDPYKWRPIAWAYQVLEQPRSSLPIIINAANETCIDLFKLNKIKFVDIINIIELCMTSYPNKIIKSIKQIYELDSDVRQFIINKWSK
jgi:1-deoxy-D-xylulose-5-phosphate reductoisomerase